MGQALSDDGSDLAPCLGQVFPPYAFPPEIRRMIYTTNAVESLHRSLRKTI